MTIQYTIVIIRESILIHQNLSYSHLNTLVRHKKDSEEDEMRDEKSKGRDDKRDER